MRTFRSKLIAAFFVLIVVPVALLAVWYYSAGTDAIVELAQENVHEIVKKNNAILDEKLARIEENSAKMITDPDLYEAFRRVRPDEAASLLSTDKEVKRIINRYFLSTEDSYSVDIATSYYAFGHNYSFIPFRRLESSKLYRDAYAAGGRLEWIPTYDFSRMYRLTEFEHALYEYKYLFSAVRLINSTRVANGVFFELPRDVQRPVLIINFLESFYRNVFDGSLQTPGAYYMILSPEGEVVSHQLDGYAATRLRPEWLRRVADEGTGTKVVDIDGRKMILCFDTSRVTGWISIAVVPVDGLVGGIASVVKQYTLYVATVVVLLSLVVAFVISGKITTPVRRLLSAMKNVGDGNFDTKLDVAPNDEFGILSRRFNDMNAKIKQLIEENYEAKLREKETEIMALNVQMNPHFLNNTLNIVNLMAIENDQEEISTMLVKICSMLQYTTNTSNDTEDFKADFEWLENYIYIMTHRFEHKFRVETFLDPLLYGRKVPKLFLQPFVENAIIHGFKNIKSGGVIRIYGWLEDDKRCFSVEDNGCGITPERWAEIQARPSVGIRNVDKRIKLTYGPAYGVRIDSEPDRGTRVLLTVPL